MNNYQLAAVEETDLSYTFLRIGTGCLLLALFLIEVAIIVLGVSS
jgi:hypothetical protein